MCRTGSGLSVGAQLVKGLNVKVLAVGVVVASAVAATVGLASGSAEPAPASTTFLLRFQPKLARFVDAPPKRGMAHPNAGDVLIGVSKVYDKSGKTALGRTAELCTLTSGGSNFGCALDVTLHLRNGTLVVAGDAHPTHSPWTAAVVGGTGAYAGARGTLHVSDGPGGLAEYWRYDPAP